LVQQKYKDRFVINHLGQIKPDGIISINYDVTYYSQKSGNGYISTVEFVDNVISAGPIFAEEREVPKGQPAPEQQQSFLSKYVKYFKISGML
jgi:hypothetical protein